jgi:hypothetical protein
MMELLSAFGLSAATGLNAYIPLLIVGLLGRFTDWIVLKAPWNILENPWVLGVLTGLVFVEATVDKIPGVDTVNDVIQTLVRPAAGAILFAAGGNVISEISPVAAMICGLLVAGSVHAVKSTARPAITASTAGMGNPVVSLVEDVVSGVTTFVAVVLPILAVLFIGTLLAFFLWLGVRWRRRRSRRVSLGHPA